MLADLAPSPRGWAPGTVVTLRHVLRGRTWCLLPVTVLLDTPDVTVVRISAGSRWCAAVDGDGVRAHTWATSWTLAPVVWTGDDCTYVVRPGRWAATGWFAPAGDADAGRFYVNAQRPVVHCPTGLETLDLELDVELFPPAFAPRWKDRDRFDRAVRAGVVTREKADVVVAHTQAAVDELPSGPDGRLLERFRTVAVPPAQLAEPLAGAAGTRATTGERA